MNAVSIWSIIPWGTLSSGVGTMSSVSGVFSQLEELKQIPSSER